MGRAPRVDAAGHLYHVLNRANRRANIFEKNADYEAFQRILREAVDRFDVELFSYCLMPNHWHLVLRPTVDGGMSRFCQWLTLTHTQRYNAHYHTTGQGHLYQGRYKSFPIRRRSDWCRWVAMVLSDREIKRLQWSIRRGAPLGDEGWSESIARRYDLEMTMRPRGRPKKLI